MTLAGLAWLIALVALVVFDIWLARTRRPTLTQWVRAQDRRFPWFRWLVIGAMVALMLHFFWR